MKKIETLETLMNRYNAVNAVPAKGHTSFVRLYGANIDCETGLTKVFYVECCHGIKGKGILRFASHENFQRFVEQHA